MKKPIYFLVLTLMLCMFCACGGNSTNTTTETDSGNFSNEVTIEGSGNFSEEMHIPPSTETTIIEMP